MVLSYDYEREANDAYYEPAWVDDRLFEFLKFLPSRVWDPACGTGTIVEAARRAGHQAIGTDIVQRWKPGVKGYAVADFLIFNSKFKNPPDAIVCNPPFKVAQEFATKALTLAPVVAFLLPTQWIQGAKRSSWLQETPLSLFLPLVPRPSMPPIGSDVKAEGGKVDYAWFVWYRNYAASPSIQWLRK